VTEADCQFIEDHLDWHSAKIAKMIGRSIEEVKATRRRLTSIRGSKACRADALIREKWISYTPSAIAMQVRLDVSSVLRRAKAMRLGPSPVASKGGGVSHLVTPPKPSGIPPVAISWARESASVSREAAMILALAGNDVRKLGWR
jgi:hypothetical protein